MAERIKGITVEIGGDTTKLQTALKGVNTEIRNTQSQLYLFGRAVTLLWEADKSINGFPYLLYHSVIFLSLPTYSEIPSPASVRIVPVADITVIFSCKIMTDITIVITGIK